MSLSDEKKEPLLFNEAPTNTSLGPGGYKPNPYQNYPTTPAVERPGRCRSACRRFLKALAAVAFVLFLFHATVRLRRIWRCHHDTDAEWDLKPSILAESHSSVNCAEQANWTYEKPEHGLFPYAAKASFELPVSSDLMFLLARGSLSHGHVKIVDSPDVKDVKVDVEVKYHHPEALDTAEVCLLKPQPQRNGVGIFTKGGRWRYHRRRDQLLFNINIYVPSSTSPSHIKMFGTYLPHFSQSVGDLDGKVTFGTLGLMSTFMPLHVESFSAEKAFFKTSHRPIIGTFNATTRLALITSNSLVKANVGLKNRDPKQNVTLFIKTKNAPIYSSVSLFSDSTFKVITKTSNGLLHLKFPYSTIDSVLHLSARTSNALATVYLNPAYEGTLKVVTSIFRPNLHVSDATDPSGKGRERKVETDTSKKGHRLTGSVQWVPADGEKEPKGSVRVKSSRFPVFLRL